MENHNLKTLERVISLYLKEIYLDTNPSRQYMTAYIYKNNNVIGWVDEGTAEDYYMYIDLSHQQTFLDLFGITKLDHDLGELANHREITFITKKILMDKINTYFLSIKKRRLMSNINTELTWYKGYRKGIKLGDRINLY